MTKKNLLEFYKHAKQEVVKAGYQWEIDLVEKKRFGDVTADGFFREYAFVVLSSGVSNKAAMSMYKKLMGTKKISSVRHDGKRGALERADREYLKWFGMLKACKTDDERLGFIGTLPYMGPATSYHLARNLGMDVAKPDRHLVKIAEHFGYDLKKIVGDKKFNDIKTEVILGSSPGDVLKAYGVKFDELQFQFVQKMCSDISKVMGDRIGTVDVILWRMSSLRPPWKAKDGEILRW